jgi:catechol 2,3-dioxygenase-like lactoylglutathione lyase family enzyme
MLILNDSTGKKAGEKMLANHAMHAALPAADLERARRFYVEKLGLTPEREIIGALFYRCGENTQFVLSPSQGIANGTHTQASWIVDDVEAEVAELKARGVIFEEYDTPSFKTIQSIVITEVAKGAWFKDSEGNLLGLIQLVRS